LLESLVGVIVFVNCPLVLKTLHLHIVVVRIHIVLVVLRHLDEVLHEVSFVSMILLLQLLQLSLETPVHFLQSLHGLIVLLLKCLLLLVALLLGLVNLLLPLRLLSGYLALEELDLHFSELFVLATLLHVFLVVVFLRVPQISQTLGLVFQVLHILHY